MDYDALTIDTQPVEKNGFNFDGGLLPQLKQFANGPTKVVITQIVFFEILRHLREKTKAAKDAVENAHKEAVRYGLRTAGEVAFVKEPDSAALARARLMKYLEEIGATIIKPDNVPMRELVQAYVKVDPPFAGSNNKKNEFPDAIALLSLEFWAKANNKRILAVSGDKDWSAFAEKSIHIDVVADLSDALAKLQKDIDQANDVAQKLVGAIKNGTNATLNEQFKQHLRNAIENADVDAEANSYYCYDTEEVRLTLGDYEIDEDEGSYYAEVVQYGRELVVVDFELRAFVAAEATFSLQGYDSIDKELYDIGSTSAAKENEEVEIRMLVTFEGDFSSVKFNNVGITNVEILNGLGPIDFGELNPDYGEPDYDDLFQKEEVSDEHSEEPGQEKPL